MAFNSKKQALQKQLSLQKNSFSIKTVNMFCIRIIIYQNIPIYNMCIVLSDCAADFKVCFFNLDL